jgi:hypothetical protein
VRLFDLAAGSMGLKPIVRTPEPASTPSALP